METKYRLEKAYLYDMYRLPYAIEAVNQLLLDIGGQNIVADIGAGTGQISSLMATRCKRVYAIEPDPSMLKVAFESLSRFPSIEVIAGVAESLPFSDGSLDLIVIGNAFQRFRPSACQELRRVLSEEGWIAVFRYKFRSDQLVSMITSRLERLIRFTQRVKDSSYKVSLDELFIGSAPRHSSHFKTHEVGWTEFVGAARSGIESPNPGDPEYEEYIAIHREVFDLASDKDVLRIGYETSVIYGQPHLKERAF